MAFRVSATVAASWLVLGWTAAQAQAVAETAAMPATAGSEPTDIIVTAQRRSESLSRTPVAVSALTSEALEQKAIRTETDLQTSVPGLVVRATQDGNQLNYSIRGQTIDAFTSSQPAVQGYVDEVPVTGSTGSALYDLESVQVLKGPQGTLFGKNVTGGAVLFTTAKPTGDFGGYLLGRLGDYGQKAVQGAIDLPIIGDAVMLRVAGNIERRHGFTHDFVTGDRYGDVKRDGARATLVLKPVEKLTNTTVVEYSKVGGSAVPGMIYSAYAPGETHNGNALFSTGSVLYGPLLDTITGAGSYAAYVAAHPGTDPAGLDAYVAAQRARGPYQVALSIKPFNRSHSWLVSNITTYDFADNLQFKNVFGFYRGKQNMALDEDASPYGLENTGPTGMIRNSRQLTEEAQLLGKAFHNNLTYVAGFYYDKQTNFDRTDVNFFDVSPIIPVTNAVYVSNLKFRTLAGYAQGTYDLSDLVQGLGFTAGVRYTASKVRFEALPGSVLYNIPGLSNSVSDTFKKTSWQFGLQEQLDPHLLLYAVTRRSFRTGGFNIFAPQIPGTAADGGNEFRPEKATDVEGGIKFSGSMGAMPTRINLAIYKEWIDNIQRSIYVTVPGVGVSGFTINIPQAQVYGVELDGSANPSRWLELGGSLAYTHGRFSDNKSVLFGTTNLYGPYPDTPRWSGSIHAQISAPLGKNIGTMMVRGEVYAQSRFFFSSLADTITPGTTIPHYAVANFRVGIDDVAQSGISVALYVKNAFDKTYFIGGLPTGNVLSINTVIPGERRTIFGEVKVKF